MSAKLPPVQRLVSFIKERKVSTFEELCNKLGYSPAKTRDLIVKAREQNYSVNVAGEHVGIQTSLPSEETKEVFIRPVKDEYIFATISDLHFGSKYHLRAQLQDFIKRAVDQGVTRILCPGDNIDGCYRHGRWELTHHGFDDQASEFVEGLPRHDGLSYSMISGNHDETFERETGMVVHKSLEDRFRRARRRDVTFLGARGARIDLKHTGANRGVIVDLWHPLQGPAYALTYGLQKKVESFASGFKPDFLFTGHWHASVYAQIRGVHAFACGTFQGAGSSFSKSLTGAPAIGGWIIRYGLTDEGTIRFVRPEWVGYFENEKPRRVPL